MKKELGQWLMDIAKYLVTAVLITSVCDDIEKRWIIYLAVITSSVFTLGGGLWLIKDSDKNEEEN